MKDEKAKWTAGRGTTLLGRLEEPMLRLPLVGRYWHVGRVVMYYSLFNFLGIGIERLVVHPLVKRQIGTAAFGDLGLALSLVTTLLMAATAGQVTTMFRYHSWRTPEQKPLLYMTGFWVTLGVSVAFACGLIAATFYMVDFFGGPHVAAFCRWLAPLVVLAAMVRYLSCVIRANLRIILSAALGNLQPVLGIAAIALIPLVGAVGAPIGASVGALLAAVATIIVMVRKGIVRQWFVWSGEEAKTFAHTSPVFALAVVSSTVIGLSGRWFLAYYSTPESVAYYWIAAGFSIMVTTPLVMASSAIVPMICAKEKVGDFSRKTIKAYYLLSLALPPAVFLGGWFVARPLMVLYGRDALAAGSSLIFYLLIGQGIHSLMVVNWGFLQKFQPPWVSLVIHVSTLAVCLGLNAWLVPRYGATGAAWAASTSLGLKGLISLVLMTVMFFHPRSELSKPQEKPTPEEEETEQWESTG